MRGLALALLLWTQASAPAQADATHGAPTHVPPQDVRVALATLDGDTVRVGDGAPTVVAVFATWCRSCKDEVAAFNALRQELAPRGVRFVALSADEIPADRIAAWGTRFGVRYPVARDTSRAALRLLGVVGVPEVHLVDARGQVVWRRRGPLGAGVAALHDAVRQLAP